MAASATDTPARRLEVCLCQCLCSFSHLKKHIFPFAFVNGIVPLMRWPCLFYVEWITYRSCRSRSHSRLMDIRSRRGRSHSRLRDIRVIGVGVRAGIGFAKIEKRGAASPPIIAPPTGICPKTPSGVTGAGIAGRLILNKENVASG